MNFSFKTIVVAAAFVAAGAANAAASPWEFVSGTGGLTFSQAALDALDASGAFISTKGADNKAAYDELTGNVALEFTSGTTSDDNVTSLTSTGSTVVIERTVTKAGKTTLHNAITLTNFVFDLTTRTLSAGVKGENLLKGIVTDYGFSPVYSAAGLEGGNIVTDNVVVNGRILGTASGSTTGAFTINTTTADNFLKILGLAPTGGVADLVKNSDWGVATANGVVRTVPEPSAYLSALAGIAILGVARMRKQKAA